MRVRLPKFLHFRFSDRTLVDIAALLRGDLRSEPARIVEALSPAQPGPAEVTQADLGLLASLSATRWDDASTFAGEAQVRLSTLAARGVVITDDPAEPMASNRRRDELVRSQAWGGLAALFYASALAAGRDGEQVVDVYEVADRSGRAWDEHVASHGPPPPALASVDHDVRVELPEPDTDNPLDALLDRRRTVRTFDRDRPVSMAALSSLLHSSFGCRATTQVHEDVVLLQRTSPSGGSMHPIEPYLLVSNVEGLAPGLYHYRATDHGLGHIRSLKRSAAEDLATRFLAGQAYAADCAALVVLMARFYRSFWKYRGSDRAWAVVAMDAGHLSQTFYLGCAQLGLGAFVSAALSGDAIRVAFEQEPFEVGPIAICGVGWPREGGPSAIELERTPFSPSHGA